MVDVDGNELEEKSTTDMLINRSDSELREGALDKVSFSLDRGCLFYTWKHLRST